MSHIQTSTTNSCVVDTTVIENIAPNIDFKLTALAMRNMYGAVKTDALPFIEKHMLDYGINTKKRMALFLASCFIMSCGFRRGTESINYSACRLLKEYPERVTNLNMAKKVVKCGEQEVANLIYSFVNGNGGIDSGDGWAYRARGPLQTRGRRLYTIIKHRTNLDCIATPEILDTLENSIIAAMAIWEYNDYNTIADNIKYSSSTELETKETKTGNKDYRSNRSMLNIRKKLDGTTTSFTDYCNFVEAGMKYLKIA